MNLQPVTSSMITHVGYDEDQQLLHIKMTSGDTYEYRGVPPEEHDDMMTSPSVGKHYNNFIKSQYEGRKL